MSLAQWVPLMIWLITMHVIYFQGSLVSSMWLLTTLLKQPSGTEARHSFVIMGATTAEPADMLFFWMSKKMFM